METGWYHNAIFYSLEVETFFDSDGDGTGDFQGLIDKLDYLAGLGITCIWLLPFFPSPNRDNGYDVSDYYNVDSRLGNLGDFAQLMKKARIYGIKIIVDLPINHTSIEHPWFQKARNKQEPYHDYYVWSDEPQEFDRSELPFRGEENTMWTYDQEAGQYYLHRFYKEQPDLNIMNDRVRQEILKIMGFWLAFGVSGFRIDAAAKVVETYGIKGASKARLEGFLDEMREFVSSSNPEAILIAEANLEPAELGIYLRGKSRMQMMFNFYVNQHLFLGLARESEAPLRRALKKMPVIHPAGQWLTFLRHHDELSIALLSPKEKKDVFARFGPEPEMQIFETGIRRRLAPLFEGNPRMIRLCHSLMLSLKGTPLIRYGDEIGMGDDLSLEGRDSVRTPMQWTAGGNGGFSKAAGAALIKKMIDQGPYAFKKVNVLQEQSNTPSLLNWVEQAISIRKQCPEIGTGEMRVLNNKRVELFVHRIDSPHGKLLFVHNFSDRSVPFDSSLIKVLSTHWLHVFGSSTPRVNRNTIKLQPYAFHWWKEI